MRRIKDFQTISTCKVVQTGQNQCIPASMEVVLRFTNLSKNWDQDGIVRRLAEGRRGMFQGSDFREVVACLREVFKKDGIDIKRWDESYGNFQIWKKKVKGLVDRDIPPIITLYDPERVEAHALVVVGYDAEGIEVYDTGDGAVKYLVFHKLEEDSVWRGDILELKKARKHRSLPRFFKKLRRIIKK